MDRAPKDNPGCRYCVDCGGWPCDCEVASCDVSVAMLPSRALAAAPAPANAPKVCAPNDPFDDSKLPNRLLERIKRVLRQEDPDEVATGGQTNNLQQCDSTHPPVDVVTVLQSCHRLCQSSSSIQDSCIDKRGKEMSWTKLKACTTRQQLDASLNHRHANDLAGNYKGTPAGSPFITDQHTTALQGVILALTDRSSSDPRLQIMEMNDETGVLGGLWRRVLHALLLLSFDDVNGRLLGRNLQLHLPFLSAHESFLLAQLIDAIDHQQQQHSSSTMTIKYKKKQKNEARDPSRLSLILSLALKNRNVSRILIQNLTSRFDWLWHWGTAVTWNRLFDVWGLLPVVGALTRFPATENFVATRNHALASIFRVLLGPGNWITRVITGGREGLITDNPAAVAQNLAAETNGFELANRNQYGNYFGRMKTNQFRVAHRLPVDESIIRTFITQPMSTMINNGIVHVLRRLADHWQNTLDQKWGNFAHQRMEQLDPFETLRFHMPHVLVALSNARGRNNWDNQFLGRLISELHDLKPGLNARQAKSLAQRLHDSIAIPVAGGVSSIVEPFKRWLRAIYAALERVEDEVAAVHGIAMTVEHGIRLGHQLLSQMNWKVLPDSVLRVAILQHIRGTPNDKVDMHLIGRALDATSPRDKRTLVELVQKNLEQILPAKLLLNRVKTLLQRELRRDALDTSIRNASMGHYVYSDLVINEWYWIEDNQGRKGVHKYLGPATPQPNTSHLGFLHIDSGSQRILFIDTIRVRAYVPVAEAISRAQKVLMTIELDHGKTFAYSAFMEFSFARVTLRQLLTVGQLACEELDHARMRLLKEVQRSPPAIVAPDEMIPGHTYYLSDPSTLKSRQIVCSREWMPGDWTLSKRKLLSVRPQNCIIVGGGPTGLLTAIHCAENCLASGGALKLYEARDTFRSGGSQYERAQIVRLDTRWISMLRYHLGTAFEDVFIPATGETHSQLGNTLPAQGFVEITIKDLETILHSEISKLWSSGIVTVFTESKARFDVESNRLVKLGEHLKVDDMILRQVDCNGLACDQFYAWRVAELACTQPLGVAELKVGERYGLYVSVEHAILPYMLVSVDLDVNMYTFRSLTHEIESIQVHGSCLPSVYPVGSEYRAHTGVVALVVECVKKTAQGKHTRDHLNMEHVKDKKFILDVGHCHVIEATGKPHDSNVHLLATTLEPYAVCCLQGLKVSMGMHNFGEKRWGSGLIDDLRSINDQNTRIVGDFTKMVRVPSVMSTMARIAAEDENWEAHWKHIVSRYGFPELDDMHPTFPQLVHACSALAVDSKYFRRQTLQTRFFETGDNFYLGMELNREYESWKHTLIHNLVAPLEVREMTQQKKHTRDKLKQALSHTIDRLLYTATFSTLKQGDVYNPGAFRQIPDIFVINSYFDETVGSLSLGEAFRLAEDRTEMYEVLAKTPFQIVARNVEGYITTMSKQTRVRRESNLTRGPCGNAESKVALATFPVGHYVNHRTFRLTDDDKGYIFAFIGDEQSTPHFMRYSGLTGAALNAMSLNNFLLQVIDGVPLQERLRNYSSETDWSNGEILQRGLGTNYGRDGFLRVGFTYRDIIDYLHSKVAEQLVCGCGIDDALTDDWKRKLAASLVPRGMELSFEFNVALQAQLISALFDKFVNDVRLDRRLRSDVTATINFSQFSAADFHWDTLCRSLPLDNATKSLLTSHVTIAHHVASVLSHITNFAVKAHLYNRRLSSEVESVPKPVDSISDDFIAEAQSFANALALSISFSAGALAFRLVDIEIAGIFSIVLGVVNILNSFSTMTNVARYKIRNEEARIAFVEDKFIRLKQGVFSLCSKAYQTSIAPDVHPYITVLETKIHNLIDDVQYYGYDANHFLEAYSCMKRNCNDVSEVQRFQNKLASTFIADTYHVNSYIQESLVEIYRAVHDLLIHLTQSTATETEAQSSAQALFDRLDNFTCSLDSSLQRGAVRWGFMKQRRIAHWDIVVVLRYLLSLCCPTNVTRTSKYAPIQTETLGILRQIQRLSVAYKSKVLRREVQDFDALFWATRESDVASLMFVSGVVVFASSVTFTVGHLLDLQRLTSFSHWAMLASALSSSIALQHFSRKFVILFTLWRKLRPKTCQKNSLACKRHIETVRTITLVQLLVTLFRIVAAGSALAALVLSVAYVAVVSAISYPRSLPFWIALASVSVALISGLLVVILEFAVRYNLPPALGHFVCEPFRTEIEEIHGQVACPPNNIDPDMLRNREAWEYTARAFLHEYRFDTVFAADRFGTILQYLQSGMEIDGSEKNSLIETWSI